MLRLKFLLKNFSRSFSLSPPKPNLEKAIIDMKFSSVKNLDSFLNDIDITRTSPSMLAYTLKIVQDNLHKNHFEKKEKLDKIVDEVLRNMNKLDSQGIVNFSEWITYKNLRLSIEKKKILISRTNELISSHSFNQKQILTIYKNLPPQGFVMMELRNEVAKIIYSQTPLSLEDISKIVIGSGRYIYSLRDNFIDPCIEKIIQLSSKEELDVTYLPKILDALAIKSSKNARENLNRLLKVIEETIPRWNEDDLISVIKFYKNHNDIEKYTYYCALRRIDKLLSNNQNIKLEFIFELASLLKEEARKDNLIDKINTKCFEIIKERLPNAVLSKENFIQLFDIMQPYMDYQIALLLKKQIPSNSYLKSLKVFQKVSWISVNNNGRLFPLTDFIPLSIDFKQIQNYNWFMKIDILKSIIYTKNYDLHGLSKIKNFIIDSLKYWLRLSNKNIEDFCLLIWNKEYSSELIKALAPLQDEVYMHLQNEISKGNSLIHSVLFYESNPEVWQDFVIKNKNAFSQQDVLETIKYYKGPFEAIIYLLKIYKYGVSSDWISMAMKRAIEVEDVEVLNDFARVLNKMDPHYLLNCENIFTKFECFNHLYESCDYRLVADLFASACKLIKDLPIDTIFSNYNIKILSFAALLGVLDTEIADLVANNYNYIKKVDEFGLLAISSKCSDVKLRENIVKQVFHEKLGIEYLRTAIFRYWKHPENKEIDSYVIDILKKIIQSKIQWGVIYYSMTLDELTKINRNDHLELFNTICTLTKDLISSNIGDLRFSELGKLLSLANKNLPLDLDYGHIISKNQKFNKNYSSEYSRERLIENIKNIGLSDKNALLAVCDKQDNFSSAYLAETLSCLADLRLEKEEWANKMVKRLIDYAESEKLVFQNDLEYLNWIYGLITFKADKSIIMKHIENSKYYDCEQLNFKHFLLANQIQIELELKETKVLKHKAKKHWRDFNYFKHFGIDKPLINRIESSCNEANLEVKTNGFIDKIWVPFYIPANNIVLWPATNTILLYRSDIFRGEFNMHQNQILGKGKNLHILNKEMVNNIGKSNIKECLKI